MYYRIPLEWKPYFSGTFLTEELETKFPSASRELKSAARCIAVDQTTASVMHSMRALEAGLGAMIGGLNITPANPNWENVLTDCEFEIKKRSR